MKDERLHGEAVDLGVHAADEGAHLAAGEPLDRLAELAHRRVLEEHAGLAQALVLAHPDEAALRGRERVLEHDADDVARPGGARGRRAAAELLLEQPDHLVRQRREDRRAKVLVASADRLGGHDQPPCWECGATSTWDTRRLLGRWGGERPPDPFRVPRPSSCCPEAPPWSGGPAETVRRYSGRRHGIAQDVAALPRRRHVAYAETVGRRLHYEHGSTRQGAGGSRRDGS